MLVEKMVFVSFTFDKKHKNTTAKMPKGMNLKLNWHVNAKKGVARATYEKGYITLG